ncbi:MAG: SDR family NAD(P)-dependent oxidoreductase [Actinomycetota bacterium]|nr:SDR family NAD(P)-dependent oxidoreductase [Actinomycetota bacterium]
MGDLTGTVALVTGAASGIGSAVAARLAARGARLALVDRDADGVTRRAEDVDGISLATDVSDPEAMTTAVTESERQLGRLDLVFLNAGTVGGQTGLDGNLDVAAYRALVGVNVDHVVYGLSAAVPALRRAGGGTVVAMSSLAGLVPLTGDPLYTMTKHAVVGYVRAAAGALAVDGIRVLALCPGFADTPLLAAQREQFGDFPLLTADDVVGAFEALLADGASGEAWFVQPGRPAAPYRFRGVPGPAGGQAPPPIDWQR